MVSAMTAAHVPLLICDAAWSALVEHATVWHARRAVATQLLAAPANAVIVASVGEAEALFARRSADAPLVVLWVTPERAVPPALREHARVAGVLGPQTGADAVYTTLRSALALARRHDDQRAGVMLERVLDIGRSLASEKDLDTLLGLILTHARELTDADGASIYTRDNSGRLYFRLWQNASVATAASPQETLVGEDSIAGYVARSGAVLVLDDAYAIAPGAPYRFNPASDRALDYRSRSLLTVPLKNKADEVVGVLQLINRKDSPDLLLKTPADVERHVLPFDEQSRAVALALAGQAGVALENSLLYASIERLFEGFIRASVQAIEARDPTTAGHSERVADYTERFAVAVDRADAPELRAVRFSKDELRELRYASLLHDFGKVGVREHVLVKAKKLLPHQLELVKQRFRYARASLERAAFRELLALHESRLPDEERVRARQAIEARLAEQHAHLARYLDTVLQANEPSVLAEQASTELAAIAGFAFPGEDGEMLPLLHDFEFADLSLPKGSLNSQERTEIESHVTHTYAFLSLIPWTKNLANLPNIAYAHHEKLDGSGYPRRLPLPQIPIQSRMMTISDIYDALTAADRPYKRAMPAERALDILGAEAGAGKIDASLFRVFVEAGAYRLQGA
jgi:HD-GYP domain-containing protein (c-di-GMP phosphodiesterase class II)